MRQLISTLLLSALLFSQENSVQQDTVSQATDIESQPIDSLSQSPGQQDAEINTNDSAQPEPVNQILSSVPLGLDSGYKGFSWGSPSGSAISTIFSPIVNKDTASTDQSFTGMLGLDSVIVKYTFADSGFWKAEIDFVINENVVENLVSKFRRLEKNISQVYGPPKTTKQQESGPSIAYSDIFDQKYATAFYRSKWAIAPAVVELYLNASILQPSSDLPIFSDSYKVLKLVYYNPDYMHSSQPVPEPENLPSIFDIY